MRVAIVRGVVPKVRRSASVIPRDKALAASDLISDAHAGGGRIKWVSLTPPIRRTRQTPMRFRSAVLPGRRIGSGKISG
jgi:hypothetical protein